MEFDNNSPVSDDQRRLAETKRITLQPMHIDVTPEPVPESEIAANYAARPMAANVDIDTEQNVSLIQPSKGLTGSAERYSSRHTATKIVAVISAVTLICVGAATLLLVQK